MRILPESMQPQPATLLEGGVGRYLARFSFGCQRKRRVRSRPATLLFAGPRAGQPGSIGDAGPLRAQQYLRMLNDV